MPLYDYSCGRHVTERYGSVNDSSILCGCGDIALRVPVYYEQFTITETGGVKGTVDRKRRDHAGEKLNQVYKNSVETARQTGGTSGPFKLPEKKTYGPRPNV